MVYQGSRKGKAGRSTTSCTSPCTDPEELSPSEGLEICSLLFREEKEAMERQCNRKKGSQGSEGQRKRDREIEARRKKISLNIKSMEVKKWFEVTAITAQG